MQMKTVVPIEYRILPISHDTWRRLLRQFGLVRKILDHSQEMEWPKRKQRQYQKKLMRCLTIRSLTWYWSEIFDSWENVWNNYSIVKVILS